MPPIFSRLADVVVDHPKVLSGCILVFMAVSLLGMTMITMVSGNDTYMSPTSERGIITAHYQDTFQQNTLVLLYESGTPLSPDQLQYIDSIQDPIENLPYVSSVSQITNVIKEKTSGVLPSNRAEIDEVIQTLPESIVKQYIPSQLLSMGMITLDPGLTLDQKENAIENIRSFIASTTVPPGLTIQLTGEAAFSQEMEDELSKSMGTLIIAALILMVIVVGLLFTYVSHRFLPILIVTLGLLFTFGLMGMAHIQVGMSVVSAFPILLGLGIDYAIQFQSRLEEESRTNPLSVAVKTTIIKTGPAVLFAMLATTMGFMAMFISPVPMIQSFGLVAIIGVVVCYLTSLIGIPLFALLIGYKPKGAGKSRQSEIIDLSLSKIAEWVAKRPVPILLLVVMVAFIGIQLDPKIPINTNEQSFVPGDMPAKVTMDKVSRTIGSTDPIAILVYGSDVISLESIQWMDRFTKYQVDSHSQLTNAVSIADYVKMYNNGTIPSTKSELTGVLEQIPEETQKQFLNGRNEAIIKLYTIKLDTPQKGELRKLVEADLEFVYPPPGIKTRIVGSFELFTTLIRELVESKEAMTYLGFLLVVVFLGVVYRNINAITPIIPIVAIVGWNAVAMYLLGIDYNILTACLGSMTIGIACQYTILVMERYIEERESNDDVIESIKNSVRKIGSAILVSGLATFFGFSALILSTFPIVSNFGLSTIIAVFFSLIGAVIVMPAVLVLLDQVIHKVEKIEDDVFSHSHSHN